MWNDPSEKAMDEALKQQIDALHAGDDETGDGRISIPDLKLQLDRIEAKLDLQDVQNRTLLRHSRVRFALAAVLVAVMVVFIGFMWVKMDKAYHDVLSACQQVNELSSTLEGSLSNLDSEDLATMMEDLPTIMDSLSALNTDDLNTVIDRLPETMDSINSLQKQLSGIGNFFGALTGGGSSGSGN